MTTLNIGDIIIENSQLAKNIKTYSVEDIKSLFIDFLNREFLTIQNRVQKKSKWGEFADKIGGSFTPEMVENLKRGREEARENFVPRSQILK